MNSHAQNPSTHTPKTTLSITQADELRGRFLTLPTDLSTVMTLASDLAHDHALETRLSEVHANLSAAYDLLYHTRNLILDLWDDAQATGQMESIRHDS